MHTIPILLRLLMEFGSKMLGAFLHESALSFFFNVQTVHWREMVDYVISAIDRLRHDRRACSFRSRTSFSPA